MKLIDYYYRAFKKYREETQKNKSCVRDRQLFSLTGQEFDKLVVKKYLCIINDDWISEIEKGLSFVENAIKEERQFIRTNGEVVPIEKVKRVSKDSVSHLARHSDLITHIVDGEIMPDKIYMTERLSDFAVYENKFLYKLLSYLKDFINLRYERIHKLRTTCIIDFSAIKKYESKGRIIDYNVNFHDENYLNEYPLKDFNQDNLLSRIEEIEQIVVLLLDTPLMKEVGKNPIIKDPIIKTNVLKMNNNFKNALALYDYLVSYKGLGFEEKEIVKEFNPYSKLLADELAEIPALISYLTNKYGNELNDILEENYLIEEKKIEEEKRLELDKQIERMKKKIYDNEQSLLEYMLLLEKKNNQLIDDSQSLKKALNKISELNNINKELNDSIYTLNIKNKELEDINKDKELEILNLNIDYQNKINELNINKENEINQLKEEFDEEKNDLIEDLNNKFYEELDEKDSLIDDLNIKIELNLEDIRKLEENNQKITDEFNLKLQEKEDDYNNSLNVKDNKINELENIIELNNSLLFSKKIKDGEIVPSTSLSKEEKFKEIEEYYKTFEKFFKSQWKITKKEIRKEIFKKK